MSRARPASTEQPELPTEGTDALVVCQGSRGSSGHLLSKPSPWAIEMRLSPVIPTSEGNHEEFLIPGGAPIR